MKKDTAPSFDRRDFLQFLGRGSIFLSLGGVTGGLSACASKFGPLASGLTSLPPSNQDQLILAKGLTSRILIEWGAPLNATENFGFNCDFTAFLPLPGQPGEALLWVNHETSDPQFTAEFAYWNKDLKKTKAQVEKEMKSVGGSILHLQEKAGVWSLVENSKLNRRLDAFTDIPFSGGTQIRGRSSAMGTLANCAGGMTPWKTFLSCEENYHQFYGEAHFDKKGVRTVIPARPSTAFDTYHQNPPEHYGWVVEIDPLTGRAQKMIGLGRFAHEGATCRLAEDGRCVVYLGDDTEDQFFYKFIAKKPGSLTEGTLYVASIESGEWRALDWTANPVLKKHFKSQLDVLIRCREAGALLGATPLDRPEDCEIDPVTGAVIVACTNNKPKGRPFGSLLRLMEKGNNPLALEFTASTWLMGGEQTGFACPDNLLFDARGNLWMTTDVSDEELNKGRYSSFGNNSLFYIPLSGPDAGRAFRIASGPVDAELTGPSFSSDGRTLFLSVQHPGSGSRGPGALTSNWPRGGTEAPRPSVVTIQGPLIEELRRQ